MKKFLIIFISCLALIAFLFYFFANADNRRLLGKVPVTGQKNIYFKVYQDDEFDSATSLMYEIVDDKDTVISTMHFLTGTLDYHEDARYFFAGSHDSVIYLSFITKNDVYAMFDLKTHEGFPKCGFSEEYTACSERGKRLFSGLKLFNQDLKNMHSE